MRALNPMTATALGLALTLGLIPIGSALAETDDDEAASPAASADKASARLPIFVPTNLGSPKTRLGGATRGGKDNIPRTEALVPEEAGQTLVAQPVLYWYLEEKTEHRIDFTLIGVDPINPILETTLEGPFEPGIQRIRLADHDIELDSGVSYQWFVAVVPNPDQRLYDRIVGGGIDRTTASGELEKKLAAADPAATHYVLAEAGVWYDALDAISQRIDSSPGDADLIAQRASLFEQVGLEQVN